MDINTIDIITITAASVIAVFFVAFYIRGRKQTERLKYEFVTIIAHKFRTPLTHIKWLIEDMVKDETEPYKRQNLADIASSNEALIKLTGTLMEVTDSGSADSIYNMERIDACMFAQAATDAEKQAFHEKNIFLGINCSANGAMIKADRTRLAFVLEVLLSNARAYTPPGRNVSVNISANRRHVLIAVKDDGIGMSDADMKRIFGKFFRSEKARSMDTEGFGIGLYLARSIVLRHGGKLIPYSAGPGQGSTFSVVLKRVR
ncbi:MAG: HAMP domain-containing histidine kinase [Patescibacteria group bacterium]|nr:HAMP domain-containing histidine kinase [Patescibacteria group bacterium]